MLFDAMLPNYGLVQPRNQRVTVELRETPDIETSTDEYAHRFDGPVGVWLLDVQWQAIHRLLQTCSARRVLDVGGGHAQLTGALLDHGYQVTVLGSDPSCAHRLKPFLEPGRCEFHVGNLLNLPYRDRSFDVVIGIRLMAHLKHWPVFLQEAGRVANEAVIIDYPSLASINRVERLMFGVKKAIEGNTRHYQCLTTRMIAEASERFDYAPHGRVRQFFLPMVLHRALKMPRVSQAIESACRSVGLTGMLGSPVVLKLARAERIKQPTAHRSSAVVTPVTQTATPAGA